MSNPRDLSTWTGCPTPQPVVLDGRHVRLEPIGPQHVDSLFAQIGGSDAEQLHRYLFDLPPSSPEALEQWVAETRRSPDALMSAVVDPSTGNALGRQALMRIDAANGVVEIGHILWGPGMSRTQRATEAFTLHARHVFDDLGYRRLEWKCNAGNAASRRAALRFGFRYEGTFAQHMVFRGANRDTAWFAILDHEWPVLRDRFNGWLDPGNFDEQGRQRRRLADFTEGGGTRHR